MGTVILGLGKRRECCPRAELTLELVNERDLDLNPNEGAARQFEGAAEYIAGIGGKNQICTSTASPVLPEHRICDRKSFIGWAITLNRHNHAGRYSSFLI